MGKVEGLSTDKQKDFVNKYFDSFYKSNFLEINEARDEYNKDWDEIQAKFFKFCDKYFDNIVWPTGNYLAFLSILNCNPRFLEMKMFQAYWKNNKGFVPVATHEILHFLFYHTLSVNYPNINDKDDVIWKLSEVFNDLILKEPDFIRIIRDPNPNGYPDLRELREKLEPIWNKTKDVKKFLQKTLKLEEFIGI